MLSLFTQFFTSLWVSIVTDMRSQSTGCCVMDLPKILCRCPLRRLDQMICARSHCPWKQFGHRSFDFSQVMFNWEIRAIKSNKNDKTVQWAQCVPVWMRIQGFICIKISSSGFVYVVVFILDKSLFIYSPVKGKSILLPLLQQAHWGVITYQIFTHDRTATEGSKCNVNLDQM